MPEHCCRRGDREDCYGVPGMPLRKIDGELYCPLHMPLQSGTGPTEKASWNPEESRQHFYRFFELGLTEQLSYSAEPNQVRVVCSGRGPYLQHFVFPAEPKIELRTDGEGWVADCTFGGCVVFETKASSFSIVRSIFEKSFDLRPTTVSGEILISHVQFRDRTWFRGLKGSGKLAFRNCQFGFGVDLTGVVCGAMEFIGIRSEGAIIADDARLLRGLSMHACNVESLTLDAFSLSDEHRSIQQLHFSKVQIAGTLSVKTRSLGPSVFEEVTFGRAPDFRGATLHQATSFIDCDFYDGPGAVDAECYRYLAHVSADMRMRNEEGTFVVLQQRATRKGLSWCQPVRWLSWLYDVVSRYGQSIGRPLFWVLLMFESSLITYQSALSCSLGEALKRTFQNIFQPFGVWRAEGTTAGALATGSVFSFGFVALLYLLALGLRWRFKRW